MNKEAPVIVHELKDWKYSHTFGYYDMNNKEIHILNKEDLYNWILYHETEHYRRRKELSSVLAALFQNPVGMVALVVFTLIGAFLAAIGNSFAGFCFLVPMILCMAAYYMEEVIGIRKTWKNFKLLKCIKQ